MKVGVSFLKVDEPVEDVIKKIDESNADFIHVDLVDGVFVEDFNYSVADIKKLLKGTTKPLDIHLMACSPNKYIKDIAKISNAYYLTVHYESHRRIIDVINMMRRTSLKIGLAINPETKVHKIIPILKHVDQVLVMCIKPGKGGQKFMNDVLYKVETLKMVREQNNFHYVIAVDGGINDKTAKLAKEAGADMVAAGTYVVSSDNYNERIDKLR